MNVKLLSVVIGLALLTFIAASIAKDNVVEIRMTIDGKVINAQLGDSATARDLLSMLPLTLTFEDYASTEKIVYPPRKLSTQGAPAKADPSIGDIAYYAPWGNLAIYYRDAGYARGVIPLGRIVSGMNALDVPGKFQMTIERTAR